MYSFPLTLSPSFPATHFHWEPTVCNAGSVLVPGNTAVRRYHSRLSEVRPALVSEQSSKCFGHMKIVKMSGSSESEEKWEGLNCVEDGMIFLGKKGKGRHSRQSEEHRGRNGNVWECRIQEASPRWVMLDPWMSVMWMVGDGPGSLFVTSRGWFNLIDDGDAAEGF